MADCTALADRDCKCFCSESPATRQPAHSGHAALPLGRLHSCGKSITAVNQLTATAVVRVQSRPGMKYKWRSGAEAVGEHTHIYAGRLIHSNSSSCSSGCLACCARLLGSPRNLITVSKAKVQSTRGVSLVQSYRYNY